MSAARKRSTAKRTGAQKARNVETKRLAVVTPVDESAANDSGAANDAGAPARRKPKVEIDPTKYLDFVRRIASRMARNLPSHVSLDDLVGAGILGLIDAKDRYDPEKAERFETFAEFRVKGAILDELRRYDIMARNARLTSKKIARKHHELTAVFGRPPSDVEVARALEMEVGDFRNLVNRVGNVRVMSLDDMGGGGDDGDRTFELPSEGPRPDEVTSIREMQSHLRVAIGNLPERQQRILEMYYQRGMTLKQIGVQVGVTESRVCQIMGEATDKLRAMMRQEHRRG